MSGEHEILKTKYEILKENNEDLEKDHASLKAQYKVLEDMNEKMKLHLHAPREDSEKEKMKLDLQTPRVESEKEEYKKQIEKMKLQFENERKEKEEFKKQIEEMKITIQGLVKANEKKEEILSMMETLESKFQELNVKIDEVEAECASVKSLYDAEIVAEQEKKDEVIVTDTDNAVDKGGNSVGLDNEVSMFDEDHNAARDADNDVIIADEYSNVNKTITDTIVILSDDSDGEQDNIPRVVSTTTIPPTQRLVEIKQEEGCSSKGGAAKANPNPPKVKNNPLSDSSSSDSEEYVLVPLSFKSPAQDDAYNKWNLVQRTQSQKKRIRTFLTL